MITRKNIDKGKSISIATIETNDGGDRQALEAAIAQLKTLLPADALTPNRAGITSASGGGLTAAINFPAEYQAIVEEWLEGVK